MEKKEEFWKRGRTSDSVPHPCPPSFLFFVSFLKIRCVIGCRCAEEEKRKEQRETEEKIKGKEKEMVGVTTRLIAFLSGPALSFSFPSYLSRLHQRAFGCVWGMDVL